MRVPAFIVSGIGLLVAWPFAAFMTALAYNQPNVPLAEEIMRRILTITLLAIPAVWLASLVVAVWIARRKTKALAEIAGSANDEQVLQEAAVQKTTRLRQERLLNACAYAPTSPPASTWASGASDLCSSDKFHEPHTQVLSPHCGPARCALSGSPR